MNEQNVHDLPDQTPPEGYEPQVELSPDLAPGIYARPSDLISDAEAEDVTDDEAETDGYAALDDDAALDDEIAVDLDL